jgi:hypothetical protein
VTIPKQIAPGKKGEGVMAGTKSLLAQELSKFYEAAWLELPLEAAKTLVGLGSEAGLRKAGWKAYDAWVSLANELTNLAYSNRIVGDLTGRTMETALRLRQVGDVMASGFFGNLWPAVGLPTQSDLIAVRDELLALREELAAHDVARLAAGTPSESTDKVTDDRRRPIWLGIQSDEHCSINSNARALRSARERKGHAAA